MPFFLLLAAGAVIILYNNAKAGAVAQTAALAQAGGPQSSALVPVTTTGGTTTSGLIATGATLAAGASSAAGAGVSAGQIVAIAGAVITGAAVGKAVDIALGGTGTGARGTVAQASFGVIFGIIALVAIVGPPFTVVLAAIVVAVAIAVYAFTILIDEVSRLSYGQAGCLKDYNKQWDKLHAQCFLQMKATPDKAGWTDTMVDRFIIPFIDGYCLELNRLAWKSFQGRPRTIAAGLIYGGQDNFNWAMAGRNRGYFLVGNPDGGVDSVTGEILQPVLTGEYLEPSAQPWANKIRSFPRFTNFASVYCPVKEQGQGTYRNVSIQYKQAVADLGGRQDVPKPIYATVVASKTYTNYNYPIDPKRDQNALTGTNLCNVAQYVEWMKNNAPSVGNDIAFAEGKKAQAFEGDLGSYPGSLNWKGCQMYWKDILDGK